MLRVNLHLCSCLNIDYNASEADLGEGEKLVMSLKIFYIATQKLHLESLKSLNKMGNSQSSFFWLRKCSAAPCL